MVYKNEMKGKKWKEKEKEKEGIARICVHNA